MLLRCLSNYRVIGKFQTRISQLWGFTRSCGKTSVRLVNRGPGLMMQGMHLNTNSWFHVCFIFGMVCIITMTTTWARWRLKSPASRLFTQPFIQPQILEKIKALRHWSLCGEFTGDRCIPRTKDQLHGKCFHLMTSSCNGRMNTDILIHDTRSEIWQWWISMKSILISIFVGIWC